MPCATIIPFPMRRGLSAAERALVARWAAMARTRGIARVYVSARRETDSAEVQDRILIVEAMAAGAAWVLHRPERRWVLTSGRSLTEAGSYAALGDALNAIRPVLAESA